nr:uncharacterized protein LOC112210448 [Halyomorpha halys]
MKLTTPLRGVGFGHLGVYVRGLVYYSLSPYHLKAFDNPIKRAPRIFKRFMEGAVHITIPAMLGFAVHDYVEKQYIVMCRKVPGEYDNDT